MGMVYHLRTAIAGYTIDDPDISFVRDDFEYLATAVDVLGPLCTIGT